MNKAKIGLLGLLLPLAALLVGPMTPSERGETVLSGVFSFTSDAITEIKRKTIWRGIAYRHLIFHDIDRRSAGVLADKVWEVSETEITFRNPHFSITWRREPVNDLSMASEADTTPPFPGAVGGGAMAMDHPEESCTDSVLASVWPQNKWFVDSVGSPGDTLVGSLMAAFDSVEANPNACNYVHFRKGGDLYKRQGDLGHNLENVYIAGQTAPGGGVQGRQVFRWRKGSVAGSHDIVIRYLRWRAQGNVSQFSFLAGGLNRIIYANNSMSWNAKSGGAYAGVSTTCDTVLNGSPSDGPCSHWTSQENLMYEPDEDHATITAFGSTPKDNPPGDHFMAYRNASFGPGWRTPASGSRGHFRIQESVEYNRWGQSHPALWANRYHGVDVIQFYTKPGPGTSLNLEKRRGTVSWFFGEVSCPGAGEDNCGSDGELDPVTWDSTTYVEGLRCDNNNFEVNAPQDSLWEGSQACVFHRSDDVTFVPSEYRRFTPHPVEGIEPEIVTMTDSLRDLVVDSAGAIRQLNSQGDLVLNIDVPDSTRRHWFHNDLGPGNGVDVDTMPIPTLAAGTAPTDTDGDGMPDDFESRYSVDDPTADPDGDRYTNYREYLNGTDPTTADGDGGGGSQLTCTFGDQDKCRQVVVGDTKDSTKIVANPDGTRDTFNIKVPDFSQTTTSNHSCWLYKPDRTRFAHVIDSVMTSGVLDSAALADTLNAWGTNVQVSHIRNWDRCRPQ